jgi:hypothetical protein
MDGGAQEAHLLCDPTLHRRLGRSSPSISFSFPTREPVSKCKLHPRGPWDVIVDTVREGCSVNANTDV